MYLDKNFIKTLTECTEITIMTYEYEGKTEKEAIEMAAAQLGLERDQFDVEIVETQKSTHSRYSRNQQ